MTDEATHLVLGDAAAGVLRDAMTAGMPAAASILRFRDIYCIGPLGALGTADGPASRARYWAQLLPDAPPAVTEFGGRVSERGRRRLVEARHERLGMGRPLLLDQELGPDTMPPAAGKVLTSRLHVDMLHFPRFNKPS